MDYRNRHVVVTGGTGALGTALVSALIRAGAICHVPCHTGADAAGFALRDSPNVKLPMVGDLSDEAAVDRLFDAIPELWASLHLAGGFLAGPIAQMSKPKLMQQLEANLLTCFLCCRAAVAAISRTGHGGRIDNVAARPALEWRTGAGMTAYAASKAAVAALTVALAEEVARQQILVNAIAPSIMDTPANRAAMPKGDFDAWPKVADVATTIMFLASPENLVTRGAIVPVYGAS